MVRRILLPLDGGPHTAEMIGRTVDLARPLGAEIVFFHVTTDDADSLRGDAALLHTLAPDQFDRTYRQRPQTMLTKAEAQALSMGVAAKSVLVTADDVATAILEAADDLDCDLIGVSSTGHPGKLPMLIESVALTVIAKATKPVLIVNFRNTDHGSAHPV